MPFTASSFSYGPVVVLRGPHKGRIGDFDNDTFHNRRCSGVVTFGSSFLSHKEHLIPITYLDSVNTQQLMNRYHHLLEHLSPYSATIGSLQKRLDLMEEFAFVSMVLTDRMFSAQFSRSPRGAKIFISHASADKDFVRGLAVDLSAMGHQPWLDEWEILAGESIPAKISSGVQEADFLVVVLSTAAVASQWVENEWQAKYWREVSDRGVSVIPALLSDCAIPALLQAKKYIDFRSDYTSALELLGKSVGKLLDRRV
jgi:hypothetical protein